MKFHDSDFMFRLATAFEQLVAYRDRRRVSTFTTINRTEKRPCHIPREILRSVHSVIRVQCSMLAFWGE